MITESNGVVYGMSTSFDALAVALGTWQATHGQLRSVSITNDPRGFFVIGLK